MYLINLARPATSHSFYKIVQKKDGYEVFSGYLFSLTLRQEPYNEDTVSCLQYPNNENRHGEI